MPRGIRKNKEDVIDKVIDFGQQLFAAVLRSRTGALTELSRLLRFQQGTKGFEREYNRLIPLKNELREAFYASILEYLPEEGLRLGIFDDSSIKKTGKKFPKLQKHHEHTNNTFYDGMKVLSSIVCQRGKVATVNSQIVGKEDNKLEVAKQEVDMLLADFLVDIFLFDSWYCKQPLLRHIQEHDKLFVSRLRCDTKVVFDQDEARLDALAYGIKHEEYDHMVIKGKSYWIKDLTLQLKAYGILRLIISKEGQHDKPIFLVTNAYNFLPKFIVQLYLKRFAIEIFFKDAKQYLNFETFMCRTHEKWKVHLLLTNILHWAIQKKNSISKTVRVIRENIKKCLLFINQNTLIQKFIEELRKRCLT